jgi:phospholipid/cholesterol/gamma-HCH transport system permease protein
MLMMSFAFVIWGSLVTFAAAILWLWTSSGVPPTLFLDALQRAISPSDLLVAIGKPLIFAILVALIATVNGTIAGRDPTAIARAATRTMIGAVTAILLTDLAFILLWD